MRGQHRFHAGRMADIKQAGLVLETRLLNRTIPPEHLTFETASQSAQNSQQGGFSRAIRAFHPPDITLLYLKAEIVE